MHEDLEEMLTRELHQVARRVDVPPLPALPAPSVLPAKSPTRLMWQPLLAAAVVALIALVPAAINLRPDDSSTRQPTPPTDAPPVDPSDTSDPGPDAVPTGPPTVPYVLDRAVHVGDRSFPGFDWVDGTARGWVAAKPPFVWSWSNGGPPKELGVALEQPPVVSPNGQYLAYLSSDGELNGFETAPGGEPMGGPVPVPVRDDDGVGTRVGAVTDEGWVIASGRGIGVLWRPYDGGGTVDLTRTAPGQRVWQATKAGLVVVDGISADGFGPSSGRVYLADVTADGKFVPIADLPNFGMADVTDEWVAWVPAQPIGGDVMEFDEIRVRGLAGGDEGVLPPPAGWLFSNTPFTFEDDQFFVARVSRGDQQRMARCSPALQECVLLDRP